MSKKGFTDEGTIPEEVEEGSEGGPGTVLKQGGRQMQGGQGTANKARTKEAAAVLKGMRVSLCLLPVTLALYVALRRLQSYHAAASMPYDCFASNWYGSV